MPKPIFAENGSGMHTHQSLWRDGETLMFDADGYGLLSETARHYVGGLLAHAPALLAFCAPTTNSYKRLVPGYEAPVSLLYSQRNRSAAVRIPVYFTSPKSKRVEFRSPDPTANPYLAFAALLMAGLDGIQRRTGAARAARRRTSTSCRPSGRREIEQVPTSLDRVLDALEADHEFLLEGERVHAGPDRRLHRRTSARRSTRSGCGRIRGSSPSTSTSELRLQREAQRPLRVAPSRV